MDEVVALFDDITVKQVSRYIAEGVMTLTPRECEVYVFNVVKPKVETEEVSEADYSYLLEVIFKQMLP